MTIFKGTSAQVRSAVNQRIERSARRFSAEVQKFSKNLVPAQLVLFHKKIALEALNRIVLKTPVDTGRARGNWQTSINVPQIQELPEQVAAARDPIAEGSQTVAPLQPFEAVFIVNNVDYVPFLENGHSKQAPQGMVAVTINELQEMFP